MLPWRRGLTPLVSLECNPDARPECMLRYERPLRLDAGPAAKRSSRSPHLERPAHGKDQGSTQAETAIQDPWGPQQAGERA